MTFRTRFAPSPTGFLHIGGARTALFCHLYARHLGGEWLLRIEDTDQERSTPEAVAAIFAGLNWLGLHPDGEPVFQSKNQARHLAAAHQLLAMGKAYRCYCTREELESMRSEQREKKEKPRYDGRCARRVDFSGIADRPYVIRFKTPPEGKTTWEDLIQGSISFANTELDDLILVRSDGLPTYNLAVVVDDHDMGITHVIRGEDHISNTPRQIPLFQALGWSVPLYAHMPLLHGADGAKLSKRHGAVSVLNYRENGFLPEAVNNYLVRLGWSHGEQEIFTMAEMESLFDIRDVGRSAAIFNQSKLEWLNGHHIRSSRQDRLAVVLVDHLRLIGIENPDLTLVAAVVPLFQERAKTMVEMAEKARFFFVEDVRPYDMKAIEKYCKPDLLPALAHLITELATLTEWQDSFLQAAFDRTLQAHDLKMGQLAQPVRIALTGTPVSPGIHEVVLVLGQQKSLHRLQAGLAFFQESIHGVS
ncbi:MAG: glutamate--tRNA ligase [Magnetococcus sp. DMHC-6]